MNMKIFPFSVLEEAKKYCKTKYWRVILERAKYLPFVALSFIFLYFVFFFIAFYVIFALSISMFAAILIYAGYLISDKEEK